LIDPLTAAREALLCLLCSTLRFALTGLLYPLPDSLQACNPVFTLGRHSRQQNATGNKKKERTESEREGEREGWGHIIHPSIHTFVHVDVTKSWIPLTRQPATCSVFFGNCVL
jgi:hypothetical protein